MSNPVIDESDSRPVPAQKRRTQRRTTPELLEFLFPPPFEFFRKPRGIQDLEPDTLWDSSQPWIRNSNIGNTSMNAFGTADYEEGTFDFNALHHRIKAKMQLASSETSNSTIRNTDNQVNVEAVPNQPPKSSTKVTALDWTGMMTASERLIGSGGFADVYLAQFTDLGTDESQTTPLVAMKKFRVQADAKSQKRVLREIQVCSVLKHENIVPFVGVCHNPNEFPCLLSEYMMNGPVNKYIGKNPETCLHAIVLGVATGLNYLHNENVVHGDLKAENILINKRGLPCLCDFGLSKILVNSTLWKTSAAQAGGTLRWQAPELMFGEQKKATKESDVYSYGVTCYEIMTNQVPFYELKTDGMVLMHVAKQGSLQRPNYAWVTDFAWDLLTKCWSFEPSERLLVSDILCFLSPHSCRESESKSQCLLRGDTAILGVHDSDQESSDDG